MASEWYGNSRNGVEIRRNEDGTPDEILMHVGGVVMAHMEQMDDDHWWAGLQPPGQDMVHVDINGVTHDAILVTAEKR